MSRHIDNLNRIVLELQDRYGDHDEIVIQLKAEIEICEAREARRTEKLTMQSERRLHSVKGPCSRVTSRIEKQLASPFSADSLTP
jgi:hypothetical protein